MVDATSPSLTSRGAVYTVRLSVPVVPSPDRVGGRGSPVESGRAGWSRLPITPFTTGRCSPPSCVERRWVGWNPSWTPG